ncbi:MAG: substrate-binding domain-containing protein [Chthoniobacterales bacterium]
MEKRRCIYIALNPASHYSRGIHQGVADYFSTKSHDFELVMALDERFVDMKRQPAGIIVITSDLKSERIIQKLGLPTVNVSSFLPSPKLPSVMTDKILTGHMAAEYLIDCRFHHFGYFGYHAHTTYLQSFTKTVKKAGYKSSAHLHSRLGVYEDFSSSEHRSIRQWLGKLPKPVGIFCSSDWEAWLLWNVCKTLDLQVGKEVGILGFGNDELFCQACNPPLSSVENRPDIIGAEAAALLFTMIRGRKPPARPLLIPPSGIVHRASTDVLASQNPYVIQALDFIRANIDRPLRIHHIAKTVALSRRCLERRFQEELNHTVLESIHVLRIERLKNLLISTSARIEEIASICGYNDSSKMIRFFRQRTGIPPTQYRARFRSSPPNSVK